MFLLLLVAGLAFGREHTLDSAGTMALVQPRRWLWSSRDDGLELSDAVRLRRVDGLELSDGVRLRRVHNVDRTINPGFMFIAFDSHFLLYSVRHNLFFDLHYFLCSIVLMFFTATLSGKRNVLVPWKTIKENPSEYVECVEGVEIDWTEPSRGSLKAIEDNWKSCERVQTIVGADGERELQLPFQFLPKILEHMRKGKSTYDPAHDSDQEMIDVEVEGEEDEEDSDEDEEWQGVAEGEDGDDDEEEQEEQEAEKPAVSIAKGKGKAPAADDDSDVDMTEFSASGDSDDESTPDVKPSGLAGAGPSASAGARTTRSSGAAVVTPLKSSGAAVVTPRRSSSRLRKLSDSVARRPESEEMEDDGKHLVFEVYMEAKGDTWRTDLQVPGTEYWASMDAQPGSPARAILDKTPVSFLLNVCEWDHAALTIRLADMVHFHRLNICLPLTYWY